MQRCVIVKAMHILLLFLIVFSSTALAGGAEKKIWKVEMTHGPVRIPADKLFPRKSHFTSQERGTLHGIDDIQLHGLVIENLSPAEVISAINSRLKAQGIHDVFIKAVPHFPATDWRIKYKEHEMQLTTALRNLTQFSPHCEVEFDMRNGEILALVPQIQKIERTD